ncbi:MAG: glycine zipper 2TM domain-containing protein [Dokdonella sp.]
MNNRAALWVLGLTASVMLAGCVAPAPRTAYYDRGYDQRNDNQRDDDRGYDQSNDNRADNRRDCYNCGRIADIERIYARDSRSGGSSGGGAVLGAIIGGLLGNTVGKGDGRTAATVGGAIAGGFAGDAVERNNNQAANAWRFYVDLDDGRSAEVVQYQNPGFRRGDRVAVRDNHIVGLR